MRNIPYYAIIGACIFCFSSLTLQAAPQITVPWQCSFEESEDLSDWVLNPGTEAATDQWVIGDATHSDGKRALYISTNGGLNAVAGAKNNIVMAYRQIHFPEHTSGYKEYDISFDWKALGDGTLYVYFDYYSTLITGTNNILQYAHASSTMGLPKSVMEQAKYVYSPTYPYQKEMTGEVRWNSVSIGAGENSTYSERLSANNSKRDFAIVFVWVNKNVDAEKIDMGACVDNIQVASATYEKPTELQALMQCEDSSFVISWRGNLRNYSVEYRRSNQNAWRSFTHTATPPNFQYRIKSLAEGTYDFRVRGWNGSDITAYTTLNSQLLFCMENHCVNYTALDDAVCTFGPTGDFYKYQGKVDLGADDIGSFHTVCAEVDQYDPRTNNQLRTIPEGELASVRLGTWVPPGSNYYTLSDGTVDQIGAATITYDITVDTATQALLLLKYAMVMEYPQGHELSTMPYFSLQVLDENGNILDADCGTKEFYCPETDAEALAAGWKIFQPEDFPANAGADMGLRSSPIYWKDWTTMGVNLQEQSGVQHGDHLKVRVISRGCTLSGHYCYGYFTLDCASATIATDQCSGNTSVTANAPDGFSYTWYAEKDQDLFNRGQYVNDQGEKIIRSTEAELTVQAGDDNVYICRLADLIEPSCYFELRTKLSPRAPVPMYNHRAQVADCQNIVYFVDSARVADFGADGEFHVSPEPCEFSVFRIRSLVTGETVDNASQAFTYLANATGDTLEVTQTSYIADGNCDETRVDTIYVPDITSPDSLIIDTVCRNIGYTFYGEKLIQSGRYVHRMSNRFGCDSLEILDLIVNPVNSTTITDTISSLQLPYVLQGNYAGFPYTYERGREDDYATTQLYTLKFTNTYDCDSTINLSLTVVPKLQVGVPTLAPLCADDGGLALEYYIQNGDFDSLRIAFDDAAHRQGFRDTTIFHDPYAPRLVSSETLPYSYPATILPDVYKAKLLFYQHPACAPNIEEEVTLDIRYASSILQQKWNDAIFLRNEDYNGGYSFTSYQWYKDGQPIEGATSPYLYNVLDTEAAYCVLLTRASDGVSQFTCAIIPEVRTDVITPMANSLFLPTYVSVNQVVNILLDKPFVAQIYTPTGMLHSVASLSGPGVASLTMPDNAGCYIVRLIGEDGAVQVQTILVTP